MWASAIGDVLLLVGLTVHTLAYPGTPHPAVNPALQCFQESKAPVRRRSVTNFRDPCSQGHRWIRRAPFVSLSRCFTRTLLCKPRDPGSPPKSSAVGCRGCRSKRGVERHTSAQTSLGNSGANCPVPAFAVPAPMYISCSPVHRQVLSSLAPNCTSTVS